jgi:hypothetical protein
MERTVFLVLIVCIFVVATAWCINLEKMPIKATPTHTPIIGRSVNSSETNPIFHRWINQSTNEKLMGTQLWFYDDGETYYDYGTLTNESGIYGVQPAVSLSGNWTALGGNSYKVSFNGQKHILLVTYYPASNNSAGITYPEHVTMQQGKSTEEFERALSDYIRSDMSSGMQ